MSSSRSDVITQLVRSSVRHDGVFFRLKSYNGVLRKLKGRFHQVSRMFHARFIDKMFQGCFKKVSGVFQGRFKGVLREF